MAHGNIAVVSAEKDLIAVGDDAPVFVDAGVYRGLAAAGADGFYFSDGVGKLHEPARAGEEVRQKVRAQAEAQDGQVLLIDELAQLVDLLGREKLRLVGDDDIVPAGLRVGFDYVLFGGYDLGRAPEADAALHDIRAVARVDTRLYQPDAHAELLVVKLRYKRLSRF